MPSLAQSPVNAKLQDPYNHHLGETYQIRDELSFDFVFGGER